jgi:hypothetical protein
MDEEQLNNSALDHPMEGVFARIPKTSPSVFHPVDGVGDTLHTSNLVIYNLFTKGIPSVLNLDQSVRAIFVMRDDVWPLSFEEDKGSASVSLWCQGAADYSFTIQTTEDLQVILRRKNVNENLTNVSFNDFEGNDESKLKLLHSAFHSKYQADLISAICLIPYKDKLSRSGFGLCEDGCVWKFQCKGSVVCSGCRWFKGFKCE